MQRYRCWIWLFMNKIAFWKLLGIAVGSWLGIVWLGSLSLNAQPLESVRPPIQRLQNEILRLLPPVLKSEGALPHGDTLSSKDRERLQRLLLMAQSVPTTTQDELQRARVKGAWALQDWGVRLTTHYLYNFQEGFLFDEGLTFRDRAYIGIEWNLLGNGLWEAIRNQRLQVLEARSLSLLQSEKDRRSRYAWLYNGIITMFNRAKIRRLQQRLDFLNRALAILGDLYAYRLLRWDDIQKWQQDRDLVSTLLRTYQTYNTPSFVSFTGTPLGQLAWPDLDIDSLPIVNLDAGVILRSAQLRYPVDSLLDLTQSRLALQYSPWKDLRLRLILRYTLYDRLFGRGRDFLSVGAALSFPLSAHLFNYGKIRKAELQLQRFRLNEERAQRIREVQNILYEYQYKIADYIKFVHKKRILMERLRREAIKHDLGDPNFQALAVLQDLGELHAVEFEMLEIQQQLYLMLARLTQYVPVSDLLGAMKRLILPEAPAFPGASLAAYLWSSGFQKNNEFLLWFLKTSGIEKVFLSLSKKVDREKAYQFVTQAHDIGLKVYGLLGTSLSLQSDPQMVLEKVRAWAMVPFDGIHLDLEPQQQTDWKQKQQAYVALWVRILDGLKPWLQRQGWALEVSIPWNLDTTAIRALETRVDRVWVMVYGKRALSRVPKLIREEQNLLGPKLGLALSTKDFKTRPALDQWIRHLENTLDLHEFALHDVEGLLELEERTVLQSSETGRSP